MRGTLGKALAGGALWALAGCVTVDDALRIANLANGGVTVSTTSSSGAPPEAPPPEPAPESEPAPAARGSSSQWATPEALYAMFSLAFSNMGFAYGGTELRQGEYVRLSSKGQDEGNEQRPTWFERAHLRDEAGGQWWRIKFAGTQQETIIVEALLDAKTRRLTRMRAKLPSDAAPREIACEELQPVPASTQMNPRSIGAVEAGTDSVTVPAGTFTARRYKLEHNGDGMDWWISDQVPGGLVKMSSKTGSGSLELQSFGKTATSELGSF